MIVTKRSIDRSKGDYPHWIDTSAVLSDCLTKTMTPCQLIETLSTGIFDIRPTEERLAIEAKNSKWRALRKEQELAGAVTCLPPSGLVARLENDKSAIFSQVKFMNTE